MNQIVMGGIPVFPLKYFSHSPIVYLRTFLYNPPNWLSRALQLKDRHNILCSVGVPQCFVNEQRSIMFDPKIKIPKLCPK